MKVEGINQEKKDKKVEMDVKRKNEEFHQVYSTFIGCKKSKMISDG